ncbi:AFR367Wp [Eremothecium gossypii ATCC 10895]|uniref:Fumarate reductase n=1 Tax=Eremothecium gossypii (strain ATCC 10895 / CBS 109.51 / FGSC 9923 / NRRL Y-1056) TaxID=284811 RepID=Q753Q1_EREGS|nr:AFR367Wp [Eremothecium gossypii ATCC 10895]AAS53738.1 AFR367Wp [Eremothecium gossypii ATCC 10895]
MLRGRSKTVLTLILLLVTVRLLFNRLRSRGPESNRRIDMSGKVQPVVVVGLGLAGLSTGAQLVKNGVPVILMDKASAIGGNSVKASSGINGAGTQVQELLGVYDSADSFYRDTVASAKGAGASELMDKLARDSAGAVSWLQNEFGVKLDILSQLGGHSKARTHRSSSNIPPGFEIISAMRKRLESVQKENPALVNFRLESKVVDLELADDAVQGLRYMDKAGAQHILHTKNVVFCTGGFGSSKELLGKYAPHLRDLPTTNAQGTTGDGQDLMLRVGGQLIDMEHIQVHPTSFVDPKDKDSGSKFLAAEALRGNGGVLLNPSTGRRFTNELATRDVLTASIQEHCKEHVAYLVLSQGAYETLQSFVNFYISKGLMRASTVGELSDEIGVPKQQLASELEAYSAAEVDQFQRRHIINDFGPSVDGSTAIYVGLITPAVHFTMGGVRINSRAEVLSSAGTTYKGLYAAGEVSGGVHGRNRLGGSSLLECVVFGRQAATSITERLQA